MFLEGGSDKRIEFDLPENEEEMEQIVSGVVIGRCAHCREATAIGLHYAPGDMDFEQAMTFTLTKHLLSEIVSEQIAVVKDRIAERYAEQSSGCGGMQPLAGLCHIKTA